MTPLQVALIFGTVTAAAGVEFAAAAALARVARKPLWVTAAAGLAGFAILLWIRPPSLVLGSAAVLAVGALAGAGLGRLYRGREAVVTFAVAAAIADIISVFWGFTGELARSARGPGSLLSYLAVSIPMNGTVLFVVGAGDLLFLAYFFTTLREMGVRPGPRFAIPVGGLLAALAFGLATPGPAPAIPFMAATVVAYLVITSSRKAKDH